MRSLSTPSDGKRSGVLPLHNFAVTEPSPRIEPVIVMAGLDKTIHLFDADQPQTWMPGSKAGHDAGHWSSQVEKRSIVSARPARP
jgi:hypothetical protein